MRFRLLFRKTVVALLTELLSNRNPAHSAFRTHLPFNIRTVPPSGKEEPEAAEDCREEAFHSAPSFDASHTTNAIAAAMISKTTTHPIKPATFDFLCVQMRVSMVLS